MYLLSVCIPTFNREQNLKQMLNSIGSFTNVEIVICDDGSTDNTRELVDKYRDKLNIKYIYQDNSGVSSAILKSYKNSSGKYVIKMDSDDLFTKNGLDFILDTIKNNPDQVAFLYGVKVIRKKSQSKNLPPNGITNFNYANFKVNGDLKQVVRREIVLKYMYEVPIGVKEFHQVYYGLKLQNIIIV